MGLKDYFIYFFSLEEYTTGEILFEIGLGFLIPVLVVAAYFAWERYQENKERRRRFTYYEGIPIENDYRTQMGMLRYLKGTLIREARKQAAAQEQPWQKKNKCGGRQRKAW